MRKFIRRHAVACDRDSEAPEEDEASVLFTGVSGDK